MTTLCCEQLDQIVSAKVCQSDLTTFRVVAAKHGKTLSAFLREECQRACDAEKLADLAGVPAYHARMLLAKAEVLIRAFNDIGDLDSVADILTWQQKVFLILRRCGSPGDDDGIRPAARALFTDLPSKLTE